MNTAILVLTSICAAGAIVTSVPIIASWAHNGSWALADSGKRKWGLVVVVAAVALVFSAVGLYRTFTSPVVITPDNAEEVIRSWIDDLGLSVQKRPADPSVHFHYDVTPSSGLGIAITRPTERSRDRYLVFGSGTTLPPEIKSQLSSLSADQLSDLRSELVLELARTNVFFAIQLPDSYRITYDLPITPNLTEDEFSNAITRVNDANLLAKASVLLNGRHLGLKFSP